VNEPLQSGDSGPEVDELHQQLAALGYQVNTAGPFDEYTEQAVRSYQEYCGLEATGVADANLREYLFAAAQYDQSAYDEGGYETSAYPNPYEYEQAGYQEPQAATGTCGCTEDQELIQAGAALDEEPGELAGILEEGEDDDAEAGAVEFVRLDSGHRRGRPSSVPSTCRNSAKACFSISQQRAWLLRPGRIVVVAVPALGGRPGHPTPVGQFSVGFHDANHTSSIYHAPMPFYVNFAPMVGFHAGSLTVRSHGCVHLSRANAERFFNYLQDGDPVDVVP
jgi:hypothetical protein